MIDRAKFIQEFTKITIHCFDVMQYFEEADRINLSVWANFRGKTYFSQDIYVDTYTCCVWKKKKWVLNKGEDILKVRGIQQILDHLEKNYQEEVNG